ncbi:thioredoxin-dependent thiol peroxidase [Breznakiella homolactica]|uniref:thioredoxin-dependent peroxiredoxin n=1 Tax=Breznakiella homolactica TaxID=2798577 RepID=A0A7T8B932_9SPIR|nr:thioredoxin-dependent thiol peroxidase [Breznakiella homolactica]QQO09214.1 thioredoxin-dependent thiol peroxidase [Breznakiella homolactica]
MLREGDKMPKFALPDQNGDIIKSSKFKGKPLVVYFYPRDSTPGCTKEACSFRDVYADYKKRGITVIGISADTVASHENFARKNKLSIILLSDPDKEVIKAFGALGEKKMFGKTYMGILRSTFAVGADGIIKKVFPKVKPEGHGGEVLKAFEGKS